MKYSGVAGMMFLATTMQFSVVNGMPINIADSKIKTLTSNQQSAETSNIFIKRRGIFNVSPRGDKALNPMPQTAIPSTGTKRKSSPDSHEGEPANKKPMLSVAPQLAGPSNRLRNLLATAGGGKTPLSVTPSAPSETHKVPQAQAAPTNKGPIAENKEKEKTTNPIVSVPADAKPASPLNPWTPVVSDPKKNLPGVPNPVPRVVATTPGGSSTVQNNLPVNHAVLAPFKPERFPEIPSSQGKLDPGRANDAHRGKRMTEAEAAEGIDSPLPKRSPRRGRGKNNQNKGAQKAAPPPVPAPVPVPVAVPVAQPKPGAIIKSAMKDAIHSGKDQSNPTSKM